MLAARGATQNILLAPIARFGFAVAVRMKVVVFAHTPPPHHGQSHMVELMLGGFADPKLDIQAFHVNARFSSGPSDLGRFGIGKIFRLLGYCGQAIWFRFRHNVRTLYYIPTPPLRVPLFRDWLVLALLRPFFRNTIFHWHAAGLGEWLLRQPGWIQGITHGLLDRARISITLGRFNEKDAAHFHPHRSVIIPNGIEDPCANFSEVQRARRKRLADRLGATATVPVRVVFLGLCIPEKGFLDAIQGVVRANELSKNGKIPFEFHLSIAGSFLSPNDEKVFRETLVELNHPATVRHIGFVSGDSKAKLLADSDILCFPTYYFAESFGLVIIEAMAAGLPIITTRWRSMPDLLPGGYPGIVEPKSPDQIAAALIEAARRDDSEIFRQRFTENFTLERHLAALAQAFHDV